MLWNYTFTHPVILRDMYQSALITLRFKCSCSSPSCVLMHHGMYLQMICSVCDQLKDGVFKCSFILLLPYILKVNIALISCVTLDYFYTQNMISLLKSSFVMSESTKQFSWWNSHRLLVTFPQCGIIIWLFYNIWIVSFSIHPLLLLFYIQYTNYYLLV